MAEPKTLRDHSKKDYSAERVTIEEINTGCLQRIADATEAMARNHNELLSENKWIKESRQRYIDMYREEEKKNRYLRAQVTRLKNQLKKLNSNAR